jgi:hypothetical protein
MRLLRVAPQPEAKEAKEKKKVDGKEARGKKRKVEEVETDSESEESEEEEAEVPIEASPLKKLLDVNRLREHLRRTLRGRKTSYAFNGVFNALILAFAQFLIELGMWDSDASKRSLLDARDGTVIANFLQTFTEVKKGSAIAASGARKAKRARKGKTVNEKDEAAGELLYEVWGNFCAIYAKIRTGSEAMFQTQLDTQARAQEKRDARRADNEEAQDAGEDSE